MLPDSRIEFVLEPAPNLPRWRHFVVPYVNGQDLRETVYAIEVQAGAGARADKHGGVPAVDPRQLHLQFFGRARGAPPGAVEYESSITVLGCSCGIVDCHPLEVSIAVDQDLVTWSSFRHPGRPWRYESLGPFRFDRVEYEMGLRHIRDVLEHDKVPGWS